jgi:hypothetical protein
LNGTGVDLDLDMNVNLNTTDDLDLDDPNGDRWLICPRDRDESDLRVSRSNSTVSFMLMFRSTTTSRSMQDL